MWRWRRGTHPLPPAVATLPYTGVCIRECARIMCTRVCVHMCVCVHAGVCVCVHMCVRTCVCVRACVCVCVRVHAYGHNMSLALQSVMLTHVCGVLRARPAATPWPSSQACRAPAAQGMSCFRQPPFATMCQVSTARAALSRFPAAHPARAQRNIEPPSLPACVCSANNTGVPRRLPRRVRTARGRACSRVPALLP